MTGDERAAGGVGLCSCAPKCDRPAERLDSGRRGYVWCGIHSWSQDIPLHVAYAVPLLLAELKWAVEWMENYEGETMPEWREWVVRGRAAVAAAVPPADEREVGDG